MTKWQKSPKKFWLKLVSLIVCLIFSFTQVDWVEAQTIAEQNTSSEKNEFASTTYPLPDLIIKDTLLEFPFIPDTSTNDSLSPFLLTKSEINRLQLKNLSLNSRNFSFTLQVSDTEENTLDLEKLKYATQNILTYFFISLSIPEQEYWVNLNPQEPDRVVDQDLVLTDIGKIFLQADLRLKKDICALTNPRTSKIGRQFWNRLYEKASEISPWGNIQIPTMTRLWIVPHEAIIYETGSSVEIQRSSLKVSLESEYLSRRGISYAFRNKNKNLEELQRYSTELLRELILPSLQIRVNNAPEYAELRQAYQALILAKWCKDRYRSQNKLLFHLVDSRYLDGLQSRYYWSSRTIWKTYVKSVKKGEYAFYETSYDPFSYAEVMRYYFSGGVDFTNINLTSIDRAQSKTKTSSTAKFFVCNVTLPQDLRNVWRQARVSLEIPLRLAKSLNQPRKPQTETSSRYSYRAVQEEPIDKYYSTKDLSKRNIRSGYISLFALFVISAITLGGIGVCFLLADSFFLGGLSIALGVALLTLPWWFTKLELWFSQSRRWYSAVRQTIQTTLQRPIMVYYPGAGRDIINPLLATDADKFIFVDINVTNIPAWLTINKICFDIIRTGGRVKQRKKIAANEYIVEFVFKGRKRTLHYYFGINAAKDNELPQIVKDGFDIYAEKRLVTGYGIVDRDLVLPTGIKYLREGGFLLTDYSLREHKDYLLRKLKIDSRSLLQHIVREEVNEKAREGIFIIPFTHFGYLEDLNKIKELIEEADQQRGEKITLPDLYLSFIAEYGEYLRVQRQEDTVRWDYLKGPDQCGLTKALKLLSKLKLLGHGTLGFMNTEDNRDRKTPAGDIDFVGAYFLLSIILAGKITEASVSEFEAERKDYFKLNANYFGPFFVILKPGLKMPDLGKPSGMDAWDDHIWIDRFESIGSELHYIYLLPRAEDKVFFTDTIERAVEEGLITEEKAQEAILKLKTAAEFIEDEDIGRTP